MGLLYSSFQALSPKGRRAVEQEMFYGWTFLCTSHIEAKRVSPGKDVLGWVLVQSPDGVVLPFQVARKEGRVFSSICPYRYARVRVKGYTGTRILEDIVARHFIRCQWKVFCPGTGTKTMDRYHDQEDLFHERDQGEQVVCDDERTKCGFIFGWDHKGGPCHPLRKI